MMKIKAIYNLYPNVVRTKGDIAYDVDGNVVEYDEAAVTTEANMMALRTERNQRLANTDWWVMPDRTATQAQLNYRQALRDITNTYTSLDDVVWPEVPNV
jgi:hypothetical protein